MTIDEWVLWKVGESGPIAAGVLLVAAEDSRIISSREWRKVDRALQRLRRRGRIWYSRRLGGWKVMPEVPA